MIKLFYVCVCVCFCVCARTCFELFCSPQSWNRALKMQKCKKNIKRPNKFFLILIKVVTAQMSAASFPSFSTWFIYSPIRGWAWNQLSLCEPGQSEGGGLRCLQPTLAALSGPPAVRESEQRRWRLTWLPLSSRWHAAAARHLRWQSEQRDGLPRPKLLIKGGEGVKVQMCIWPHEARPISP